MHDACLTTLAYFIPDRGRNDEYYYTLVHDLASKTDLNVRVYTNRPEHFSHNDRLTVIRVDLDEMVADVWPNSDWRNVYSALSSRKAELLGTAQVESQHLIGIWLSKIWVIRESLRSFNRTLWIDAGLLYSMKSDHRFDSSIGYDAERLVQLTALLNKRQTSQTLGVRFTFPGPTLHGIDVEEMRKCTTSANTNNTGISAGLLCVHCDQITRLYDRWCDIWANLIANKQAGTEESILTILGWDQQIETMTWDEWFALLYAVDEHED
jgi:hypothetical protein